MDLLEVRTELSLSLPPPHKRLEADLSGLKLGRADLASPPLKCKRLKTIHLSTTNGCSLNARVILLVYWINGMHPIFMNC